jgi:NADPH2:quinone reductase
VAQLSERNLGNVSALPAGLQVVVSELGETPVEAMERFVTVGVMEAPDVGGLAADEVLIAVKSASVGWVDLIMTSGQYQHVPTPPYTPGLEYAGVVAWKGALRRA